MALFPCVHQAFCFLIAAGLLSKTKGDVLTISAIFRAMNMVLDPAHPDNLRSPSAFLISDGDVRCAWNFIHLTTRQRIAFENDSTMTRICGEVLGWTLPEASDDESDDEDEASDGEDDLVSVMLDLDAASARLRSSSSERSA